MTRRLRQAIGVVALVGAALWACSPPPSPPPKPLTFNLVGDLSVTGARDVVISADGRELGHFAASGPVQVDVPAREPARYTPDLTPKLSARALFPCGWRDLRLPPALIAAQTEQALKQAADNGKKVDMYIVAFSPLTRFASIWVDKPADATVTLAVGSDERTIGPGSSPEHTYALEDCDGARNVSLNGKRIGELPTDTEPFAHTVVGLGPEDAAKEPRGNMFLVDTTGTHCYRAGYVSYADPKAYVGSTPRASRTLGPAVFHRLERMQRPDYFMEQPPSSITSSDLLLTFRDYVYRTAC